MFWNRVVVTTTRVLLLSLAVVALGACAQRGPPPDAPVSYMVFFDLGSAKISEQSQNTVLQVAEVFFRSSDNARISVTGYADTVGSPAVNMQLSTARANKVRDDLMGLGVPASAITVRGAGEEGLVVLPINQEPTAPRNRRVVIVVTGDYIVVSPDYKPPGKK